MKILQVIASLDPNGGGPIEGLIQQGKEMSSAGHDVHTVSLDKPGYPVDPRMESSAVYMLGPGWLRYGYTPRLEPWLREHGPTYDVVIVHGMWQYHGYCVAKVARSIGVRYVIFLHGMLDPWFAKRYPLKHLKKWLYWPWGEYRVLKGARLVLFTTEEELYLARRSFWLYRARERLVGYGIQRRSLPASEGRAAFYGAFPHLAGKRNLLFLSRIHPKKGCDLLLDAFGRVASRDPALHLVFAGPDGVGWQAKLTEQARQLGLSQRVTFTGMLRGPMKWGAFDAADAFVLPSHQENFGIVVAEALTSGVPVLTTNKVNTWREVVDGGAGIVHEDTPEGIHRLLSDWLALDDASRIAMRQRTVACFEKHFELGRVTDQLLEALKETAKGDVAPYSFRGSWRAALS
jgi:glycosyltransferase involved in cell wall biosynthesis